VLIKPRPEVTGTPTVVHGSLDYAELERLGMSPEEVLDFSVNSNPCGPSPHVQAALARVPVDRYPDRECCALRRALARHLGIAPAQVVVGNGTAELLWLTGLAFMRPGDRVLVIGPTFGEYARAATLMGAEVEQWRAAEETGLAVEPDAVAQHLSQGRTRVVFLCNPNNPTGRYLPPETIVAWAQEHPRTLFVVDEAYISFAANGRSLLSLLADNVLVLRSMTKDYALAGLRLGYAVGHEKVTTALAAVRPPWNVNAAAQAAGIAALSDQTHLRRSLSRLAQAKKALVSGLVDLGLRPLPSAVHFFLVRVGDAAAFRRALLQRGVLVRDCASFGLPTYVRIATRRPEENACLLATIREVGSW